MDIHRVNASVWVNSAFFGRYCIFILKKSDVIIRLEIIMEG